MGLCGIQLGKSKKISFIVHCYLFYNEPTINKIVLLLILH